MQVNRQLISSFLPLVEFRHCGMFRVSRGSETVKGAEGADARSVRGVQGVLGDVAPESADGDVQN